VIEVLRATLRTCFSPEPLPAVLVPLDEAGVAVVLAAAFGEVRVPQDVETNAALILGVHQGK
jgi:hypothetical protein